MPSSLLDGHGCLRYSNKSERLGVLETLPKIVDVSQLVYHMVWPHGGSPSNLIASSWGPSKSFGALSQIDKIIVFDKYNAVSAKDHERMWRA